MEILLGLLVPFAGTVLGAACVFFLRDTFPPLLQKCLLGFASGVMSAASIWSLIIPAMDQCAGMGRLAFLPAAIGFLAGIAFLLVLDHLVPHLHLDSPAAEGPACHLRKSTMLILAVTIHNIPEGMAVGVVFAGLLAENTHLTLAGAFTLSLGIALQNFPEGAIISMPLRSSGQINRRRAFVYGSLSGIVEPIAGAITIALSAWLTPLLPYLLSFAAGAMIYVVVEELIPEASEGTHSNLGTIGFAAGFVLMMILDVALG